LRSTFQEIRFDPRPSGQYNEPDVAALQLLWDSLEKRRTDRVDRACVALVEGMQDMRTATSRLNTEMIPKDPEGAPHTT
jgi:hypothetical protein